ncbi:hypothetical protein PR202_gb28334 [Eleusine coracana subsp. coracana]|uniref:Exocyst subunit Exo70 family protein n=1 Tax=Eleusine coracana subsp. coracana TaxID=191504 RepID=A0AAV5FWJ4_ELECO|nr:hypothetical protein PR202_gb28334 [Eleusine coracana subsp. coracana]
MDGDGEAGGGGGGPRDGEPAGGAQGATRAGLDKSRALSRARYSGRAPSWTRSRRASLRWRPRCARSALRATRSLAAAGPNIDRAVGPAAAVLKVFDAVHGLEPPLLARAAVSQDLPGYLAVLAQLEQARSLPTPGFVADLAEALGKLKDPANADLDGGLLSAALDILEVEFRRLLVDHSAPLAMKAPDPASIAPPRIPPSVVRRLSLILDRLAANGRLDVCSAAYADARGETVNASLRALGLEYLQETAEDARRRSAPASTSGAGICKAASSCFAEIAARAGILDFLKFGRAVADARKDPIKLLRLLDVFDSLNKLRPDFKPLVQLQRNMPPPVDGGVPRLVSFVATYSNQLLGDQYRSVLTQVVTIHRSWRKEPFNEKMLVDAVLNIVKTLEANFDTWSKAYGDVTLSYLFMMNSHWHFFKHLKDRELQQKTCHLVVQAIVPVYRSFMQNYGPLVEQDISANRQTKESWELPNQTVK